MCNNRLNLQTSGYQIIYFFPLFALRALDCRATYLQLESMICETFTQLEIVWFKTWCLDG